MIKQWAALAAFCFLIISLAQGCASIQPPPGGPEDKTPPTIVTATPADRSINVPRDTRIHIEFENAIDKQTLPQAFSITPYLTGLPTFKWSGYDEVDIVLPGDLRENTTYTVTLGRSLKTRRGNTLVAPFHLTFSTGPQIDTGMLTGILLPSFTATEAVKSQDIFLFGYDVTERSVDTLHLNQTPPDILTQAGDNGLFEFLAMKIGHTYRIFAVEDAYRNNVYDPGIDNYGMPTHDAVLDSTTKSDFRVRMAPSVDTTHPEFRDAEATDSIHARLRFSEALDSISLSRENFTVQAVQSGRMLPVNGLFLDIPDRRPNEITLLLGEALQSTTEYLIATRANTIKDKAGNVITDSLSSVRFTTLATFQKARQLGMKDFTFTDSTKEVGQAFTLPIAMTDALDRTLIDSAFALQDSGKRPVPIQFIWHDDARFDLRSTDTLRPKEFYQLTIRTKYLRRPGEATAERDTTLVFHFQTSDLGDAGRLGGEITVADSILVKYANGFLVVNLVGTSSSVRQTISQSTEQRKYVFDKVPGGKYRIFAYLTNNQDKSYDPGSVIPFRFAAPNGDFPGEVDVRPRWEIDKVNIELK